MSKIHGDSIIVKMTNPVFAEWVILTKYFCSDMYGSQTLIESVDSIYWDSAG